jgi:hypothetical protein
MRIDLSMETEAPRFTMAGFYLMAVDRHFELRGREVYLGADPESGLRSVTIVSEGMYAILHQGRGRRALAREWGALMYWGPGRWRLRSRDGRTTVVPQAPARYPASNESVPAAAIRGGERSVPCAPASN